MCCLRFVFLFPSCSFPANISVLCLLCTSVNPLLSLLSSQFWSSLLKEAEIHAEQREFELNRRRQMGLSASHHSLDNIEFDNKEDDQHDQRLLSQFGIWFLVRVITGLFLCLFITRRCEIRMCTVQGLCWIHCLAEVIIAWVISLLLWLSPGEPVHP